MYKTIASAAALSLAAVSFGADRSAATASNAITVDFNPGFVTGAATSLRSSTAERAGAAGDNFSAAILGQNSASAFFLDDFPDDFTWAGGVQDAGVHLVTGADTRLATAQTKTGTNYFIQASSFTLDSSDYLPTGIDPQGNGDVITQLRFDLGGAAAASEITGFPDPINWDPNTPLTLNDFGFFIAIDGAVVQSASLLGTTSDLNAGNNLAGVVVLNGAAGAGIDEIGFYWDFDKIPTPGALALFGLAGLATARRRR